MAQAFITTAKNSYRWNVTEKVKPIKQEKYYEECYGKDMEWLTHEDLLEKKENFEKVKAAVKQLQVKRMSTTTYQTDYCRDWKKSSQVGGVEKVEPSLQNQLLESLNKIYKGKTGKVLPTIPSQRILGYLAPSRMYTPISTYQDNYGREGYEQLCKN